MGGTVPVSIGLPVFNGARYLGESLASIRAQTFVDYELVICDNASTDVTPDLISDAARDDDRIRVFRSATNDGAAANYNRTFARATGRLFKWASHDDRIAPTFLERCVAELDASAEPLSLVYPQTLLIDEVGAPLSVFDDRLDLRQGSVGARLWSFANRWKMGNALMGLMPRGVLGRTGLIRPYPTSDLVLLAELALLGPFHEIAAPLFERRIHEGSATKGARSVDELDVWFSTSAGRSSALPPMVRFLIGTDRALLAQRTAPLSTRVVAISAFSAGWATKRTRVHVGRWRRRLRRSGGGGDVRRRRASSSLAG